MKRSWATVAALVTVTAMTVTACGGTASSAAGSEVSIPDELSPEAGTDIPAVTIDAGFSPIGDGLIPVIGSRLGYFEEAGIAFADGPEGLRTDLLGALTPLLNGQVEIGNTYMPLVSPQLDSVENVTSFAFATTFHGTMILAPEGEYTTLREALDSGLDFDEAAAEVMEQMRGEELLLFTGADPAFYDLALSQADMSLADVSTTYMGDPDMITAASAGRADFVSPNGAVQISQLQYSGWEPLVTITDLIEALPEESLSMSNTQTGFVTTEDFAAENYNTLLRFTSVLFRIVADLQQDPVAAADVYVDYVNSYTGSSMSTDEAARLFTDGLYTLNPYESYADVVTNEGSGVNYYETTQAQIDRLREQGVLSRDHDVEDVSIARQVHEDLVEYQQMTDELLAELPDGEQKAQAQEYYDHYNFLDAYRVAVEAQGS